MGQNFLGLLAKAAGLVANPSTDDKAGWDFELENPSPTVLNYECHSKPLYRVQVKATIRQSLSVPMSYSSLLSLIQFPGPAYVFLVRFASNGSPIAAHLIHLDQDTAKMVLASMRRKEIKRGSAFRINKSTISLKFTDAPALNPLTGVRLREMLIEETGENYLQYVHTKTNWLRELEWESKALRFSVRFEDVEAVQAMADGLLGFNRQIRVDSVSYRAPMGIPTGAPKHTGEFRPTEVKPLEENIRPVTVRLKTHSFGAIYTFAADMYSNVGIMPAQFAGGRIKASMFDLVYRTEPPGLQLIPAETIEASCRVPLRDFKNFLAFMEEASKSSSGETYLEVLPSDGLPPLQMSLPARVAVCAGHGQLLRVVEALYLRLERLGLGEACIATAVFFQSSSMLSFLEHVGATYPEPLEFDFVGSAYVTLEEFDTVVFKVKVELGTEAVFIFGAFFGAVTTLSPGKFRGSFERSEYVGEFVAPNGTDFVKEMAEYEERLHKLLQARGRIVLH